MRTIAAAAVLIAVAVWPAGCGSDDGRSFEYEGPLAPAFGLDYEGLQQEPAGRGELGRFASGGPGSDPTTVTVAPLRFPAGGEAVQSALPRAADRLLRRALVPPLPGRRKVFEGPAKVAVDEGDDAYAIAFTATAGKAYGTPSLLVGKLLLVPGPDHDGRGVAIQLRYITDDPRVVRAAQRDPAGFFEAWPLNSELQAAAGVSVPDTLEKLLQSFSFG